MTAPSLQAVFEQAEPVLIALARLADAYDGKGHDRLKATVEIEICRQARFALRLARLRDPIELEPVIKLLIDEAMAEERRVG